MTTTAIETATWEGPLPTCPEVARLIDHSLLRPELTREDVLAGLKTATRYRTASVCVRPADVVLAVAELAGTEVEVGTVVGFPHGASTMATKSVETREVVDHGASEIDMVINIGRLRDGDIAYVEDEIASVVSAAEGRVVKVIFENSYLDREQKVAGYLAAERAGAAYIKTSTGFASGGATAEDIKLMRTTVGAHVAVKAAGGVRSLDALLALYRLGATRFGATATATILDDLEHRLIGLRS